MQIHADIKFNIQFWFVNNLCQEETHAQKYSKLPEPWDVFLESRKCSNGDEVRVHNNMWKWVDEAEEGRVPTGNKFHDEPNHAEIVGNC